MPAHGEPDEPLEHSVCDSTAFVSAALTAALTPTRAHRALADWLAESTVELIVMENTSRRNFAHFALVVPSVTSPSDLQPS